MATSSNTPPPSPTSKAASSVNAGPATTSSTGAPAAAPTTPPQQGNANANANANAAATTAAGPAPAIPPAYVPMFYSGQLPAPTGEVAQVIDRTTKDIQRKQADDLHAFLFDPNSDLRTLNHETDVFTALVSIPDTHKVKLVYAMGLGTSKIGKVSTVANKFLVLHGEGGPSMGNPPVMVLENKIRTVRQVHAASEAEIDVVFKSGNHNVSDKVKKAIDATDRVAIMRIAPIPAYLVYDGFNMDLEAAEVYERLKDSQHTSAAMDHALQFLRACMVGSWRKTDATPFLHPTLFNVMPTNDARVWAHQRFQTLFPSLLSAAPPLAPQVPLPPAPTAAQPPAPPVVVQHGAGGAAAPVFNLDAAALQQFLNLATRGSSGSANEEKKEEESEIKVSKEEKRRMRVMCGLPDDSEAYPSWFTDIFGKHLDEKDKVHVIACAIRTSYFFDDAEVPLYPTLLKMCVKRDWTASDLGPRPSFANSAKGLSPFGMIDFTLEDIAIMTQDHDDLTRATSVSATELKATRAKLAAMVPDDGAALLLMLQRYANLIFALFTSQSPMYKQLYKLIKAIKRFSPHARKNLPHRVRASILWIVLLQSRRFAMGEMVDGSDDECLGEFSNLLNQLWAMSCAGISHEDMPDELKVDPKAKPTDAPTKRPRPTSDTTTTKEEDAATAHIDQRTRRAQIKPYSAEMKKLLAQPMRDAKYPGINLICKYCGMDKSQLLPEVDETKDCLNYLVLGNCRFGKTCRFNHLTASTAQVEQVKQKWNRFITDPLGLGPAVGKERVCSNQNLIRQYMPSHEPKGIPPTNPNPSARPPPTNPAHGKQSYKERTSSMEHAKEIFVKQDIAMTPAEHDAAIRQAFANEDTIPDIPLLTNAQGKIPSLVLPRKEALEHAAAELINYYATHGCPVDCGDDWSVEHIEAAIMHGAHPSADSMDAMKALHDETTDKVKNGYAKVVRYGDIRRNLPKKLKISPVAMIPHKSRLFRTILDLSFQLRFRGKLMQSVNSATVPLAPAEAMVQLGNCIQRLVATLADNYDPQKPFKFAKLDIKDGFWRMAVSHEDAWNFCYVLPQFEKVNSIDDMLLVVPSCLQMGWCESPPFFCASSETARDVITTLLHEMNLPEHEFEGEMMREADPQGKTSTMSRLQAASAFINLTEVFVDDFVGATNNTDPEHLRHFSRAMLYGIHSVFPPPSVTGHQGQDPISQKKLREGEGTWAFTKEILGWIVDGANFTIQLMPEKCSKIAQLIKEVSKMSFCPIKKYQELAGKLQHASFAIPGGKGLFSPIHRALKPSTKFVKITKELSHTLRDRKVLILHLASCPTPVQLLVSDYPNILQYTDACKLGAGGVIVPGMDPFYYYVWQFPWPKYIQDKLVSWSNPKGELTINDLELAGMVLGWLVIEYVCDDLRFKHVGSFCDNTSAVAWSFKGHTTTSLAAGRLLRFLALRQRIRQTSSLVPMNIAGKDNRMADIPSRAFKSGKFLDRIQDSSKARIASDLLLAWRATADGVTAQTAQTREKYWKDWTAYCAACNQQDPYLEDLSRPEQTIILLAFAARVRSGALGRGNQVRISTVADALAAISQTCKLVGKQSPVLEGEGEYILPIKRMMEGFRRQDPPSIPQMAIPKDVPDEARRLGLCSKDPLHVAAGDLAIVAFYFLLRSGEYTKPRRVRRNGKWVHATRTKQFRVGDIGFWKDGHILPRRSGLTTLLQADSATMKISNQKNGRTGQTLHHESTGDTGAVASLARRVHHILDNGGNEDNLICDVFAEGTWMSVESAHMVSIIRTAAKSLRLQNRGIDPDLIGAHSLRAGGAMALKIMGYKDSTIRKFGRWTSDTWMMYIHSQIAHLSKGVAQKMSQPIPFHNIAFIERPQHVKVH